MYRLRIPAPHAMSQAPFLGALTPSLMIMDLFREELKPFRMMLMRHVVALRAEVWVAAEAAAPNEGHAKEKVVWLKQKKGPKRARSTVHYPNLSPFAKAEP